MSFGSTAVNSVVKAMVEWDIFLLQFPSDRTHCCNLKDIHHESLKFRGYLSSCSPRKCWLQDFY
jgi:hypothetical protein